MKINFFKKEKSRSLNNQRPMERTHDEANLELLMYGNSAKRNEEFVRSQVRIYSAIAIKFLYYDPRGVSSDELHKPF